MALHLNHFDTKTKQDTGIREELKNTLAEYLFSGVEFSIGTAYPEATVPEDLGEHNGMTLQFSAGKRMYFASDPTVRDSLYPNPSDGAAYPLPFTPNRTFQELKNVRILVVDDATGENGGIIALDAAKKLVGDCKGLIDKDFALANSIEPRGFQFRLGVKPQAESHLMRIAKGTLAPASLDKLGESSFRMGGNTKDGTLQTKIGYDMVLATSSFKGRKGEDAIQPGEYMLTVGLGVKALAQYRQHSLGTQILVNYPGAVEQEILPIIKQQASQLAQEQKDPRQLARRYIETYERRQALLAKSQDIGELDVGEDIEAKFSIFDTWNSGGEVQESSWETNELGAQKDLLLYSLLKTDLSGHYQLIEHPKIIAELQEFVRKEWLEIATGRAIKFTSGLAQPSLDLQANEICIPHIDEGEEIIVTRSPLVNSNGVITLKNKHLPEMLSGCVHIHPATAMDNMQCDFDGDLLAYAPSSEFPILAAEVKQKNLPENRYPDIVKKAKVPYQGTFAEIAATAMSNKIGIIANEIQKNVALQCEIDAIPEAEKSSYLNRVSTHLANVLTQHQQGKLEIPDQILEQIESIAASPLARDNSQIEQRLQAVKTLFKDCVGQLGNELQVAADGPKSALRPDDSIIQYCQAVTAYKEVEWLADKKNPEAFTNRGMKTNGYSPIDLMIQQTNEIFEQSQLAARPIEQFRNFYPRVEFTPQQKDKALEIKATYNSLIRQRLELEAKANLEPGPYMVITSPTSGRQLEITNLIRYDAAKNVDFWNATELTIAIESRKPTKKMPQPLMAVIKSQAADGKEISIPIGTVSNKSIQEHNLKPGTLVNHGKVEFLNGVSDSMIDALKQQTQDYVASIQKSTPEPERLQLAAAIHDVTHTDENKNYAFNRRAGVAFAVFPDLVIGQLEQLQFTQMRVLGTQFNECADRNFLSEKVTIKFEDGLHPREQSKTARWVTVDGKRLGTLDARAPHLPAGTQATATITSPPPKSVIVTSLKHADNQLQIDNVDKYSLANHFWHKQPANITLEVQQPDSHKPLTVFALVDNQILGVVNKRSVEFLQSKLTGTGKQMQGLTLAGTVDNAPASYADLVIDPTTVKYPEMDALVQPEQLKQESPETLSPKSAVATVVIVDAPVEPRHQTRTDQVMTNMVKRAVDRAVERQCDTVRFVDASPYKEKPSAAVAAIRQLMDQPQPILIELVTAANVKDAIATMQQPEDIMIGTKSIETTLMIDYAAQQKKAVAAYIPETGGFQRQNLPSSKEAARKNISPAKDKDMERER